MFKLWGKVYKENRMIKDTVVRMDEQNLSRDLLTNTCMDKLCDIFDIQHPMWLKDNDKEYPVYGRTTFKQDHFIEEIDFDLFEIEIIEDEDSKNA
ncbi:hypothetical protein HZI73_01045 [Vallitalea pronyensis]|uniref:Uncharacterized protein n=1 Tax=Vallitalea pronyensis TaxID=1348613 RepID=A0A8J8SEU2_9FIRM|nr:hypothetical protein [Vallitalea pronyensis]QUI20966.1 hypothetical protein HZI73_01045 [Vallitalea pronyensis]